MLTEVQQIVLWCLLGPEDPGAFVRENKRQRKNAWAREDRRKNLQEVRAKARAHRALDPEKARGYQRAYTDRNREHLNKKGLSYVRARRAKDLPADQKRRREQKYRQYHSDPNYKILFILRARIAAALSGIGKSVRTRALLGCTIPQWRSHLEKQFRPGMTWENYGPVWHVDHRRPCSSFNLTDPDQQRACFHYTNTQPLFAGENLKKGASY